MKLDVWQRSMDLVADVYVITARLPRAERFGLTAQIRRAAVSVPSNIAEAEGRRTWRDRAHFYAQARGSLYELSTELLIAQRVNACDGTENVFQSIEKVAQLINGTLRNLRRLATSD